MPDISFAPHDDETVLFRKVPFRMIVRRTAHLAREAEDLERLELTLAVDAIAFWRLEPGAALPPWEGRIDRGRRTAARAERG